MTTNESTSSQDYFHFLDMAEGAFKELQRVKEGEGCYHTCLSFLAICMTNGVHLSDIGTDSETVRDLAHLGSINSLKMLQRIRDLVTQQEFSPASIEDALATEVECGYVSMEDLETLGLIEFAIYLPKSAMGSS